MVQDLASRFDRELLAHATEIQALKVQIFGGLEGHDGVVGDLQKIVDGMRAELNRHMQMATTLSSHIPNLRHDVLALKQEMQQLREGGMLKGPAPVYDKPLPLPNLAPLAATPAS